MPISQHDLEEAIRRTFPDAEFTVKDLAGDNDHYALEIASEQFRNKSRIAQHQLVNEALRGIIGDTLHALALKTIPK